MAQDKTGPIVFKCGQEMQFVSMGEIFYYMSTWNVNTEQKKRTYIHV